MREVIFEATAVNTVKAGGAQPAHHGASPRIATTGEKPTPRQLRLKWQMALEASRKHLEAVGADAVDFGIPCRVAHLEPASQA